MVCQDRLGTNLICQDRLGTNLICQDRLGTKLRKLTKNGSYLNHCFKLQVGDYGSNSSGRNSTTLPVKKRHFLRHLYATCISLPRQARNKHTENSKKEWRCVRSTLSRTATSTMTTEETPVSMRRNLPIKLSTERKPSSVLLCTHAGGTEVSLMILDHWLYTQNLTALQVRKTVLGTFCPFLY